MSQNDLILSHSAPVGLNGAWLLLLLLLGMVLIERSVGGGAVWEIGGVVGIEGVVGIGGVVGIECVVGI